MHMCISKFKMMACCDMPKGTSRDKATSNSEKIKPVALAVIELCLSEGSRQLGSQKKIPLSKFFLDFVATYSKHVRLY